MNQDQAVVLAPAYIPRSRGFPACCKTCAPLDYGKMINSIALALCLSMSGEKILNYPKIAQGLQDPFQ